MKRTGGVTRSFQKNKYGILLMLLSSFCVCLGQLFFKRAMQNTAEGIFLLLAGLALYGAGAVIMFLAYSHGSLSVLQPMLSFNYIFVLILAKTVLGEEISFRRLAGVFVIIAGTVLIGGGDD